MAPFLAFTPFAAVSHFLRRGTRHPPCVPSHQEKCNLTLESRKEPGMLPAIISSTRCWGGCSSFAYHCFSLLSQVPLPWWGPESSWYSFRFSHATAIIGLACYDCMSASYYPSCSQLSHRMTAFGYRRPYSAMDGYIRSSK